MKRILYFSLVTLLTCFLFTSCTATSLADDDEFQVVSTEGDSAKKKAKPDDD